MKTLTREEAVQAIREKLLTLVDDEHSACEIAARRGIFCRGFSALKTGELRSRYGWIVRNRLGVRRAELEDLANRWQLARQWVLGVPLACDVQSDPCETHRTCSGWEGFADPQIAAFYRELLGEGIEVLSTTNPEA